MFERGEECFSPACICVCQCCGSFWLPGIAESGLPHLRAPLDFGLVWGSLLIGLASDSSQSSCRSCFGFESVQLLSVLWTGASTDFHFGSRAEWFSRLDDSSLSAKFHERARTRVKLALQNCIKVSTLMTKWVDRVRTDKTDPCVIHTHQSRRERGLVSLDLIELH